MRIPTALGLGVLLLVVVFAAPPAHAQTYLETVIHNFAGPDGSSPSGLVAGSNGNLYGTTGLGGTYNLAVMNGIEAARVLKRLMPASPVIIFSEYSDVFSEQEARSAGVSALVSKSEHVSVLLGKARSLLDPLAA